MRDWLQEAVRGLLPPRGLSATDGIEMQIQTFG